MALDTFNPGSVGVGISPGSSLNYEPRKLVAEFGDGYVQRSGDGINSTPMMWDIEFQALRTAEKVYIADFFLAHKGYMAFLWTAPGEAFPSKFICEKWSVTALAPSVFGLRASFRQVFDNDA